MAAKKPATYCNPFWTESFPDPFVLKVRGRYYAYAPSMRPIRLLDRGSFPS